ncbi:unnamed protein product [[Candida] boidinii]|nr:unnamed protein product [[Candida] boidinii]
MKELNRVPKKSQQVNETKVHNQAIRKIFKEVVLILLNQLNNGFYLNPNENEDDPFFVHDGDFPPIANHDSIFEFLNPNYTAVKESLNAPGFHFKSEKIRTKLIYHQPGKTKFFGLLSYASLFRFQPEIYLIWRMSEGFYISEKKKWGSNKLISILNDLSFLKIKSGNEDKKDKNFHEYIELFLPNWIIFEKTIKYFYDHLSFFYDFIELKYLDRIFKERFKKDELTGKTLINDPEKSDYSDIALVLSIHYLVRRVLSESNMKILEDGEVVDQEDEREEAGGNLKNGSKSEKKNIKRDNDVDKMYENVLLIQLILFLSEITVTGLSAILIMIQIRSVNKDGVEPSEVIAGADLLGRAVSTAYNIGLHIDPDLIPDIFLQNSPVSKRTWRLLWQHVRFLDVRYSCALGAAPLITDVDLYRVTWNDYEEEFIFCEKCIRLIHKVSKFFSKTVKKLSLIEIVSVFIEVFKFYNIELPSFEELIFQKNSLLSFRKKINVRRLQMKLEILSLLLLLSELIRFASKNVDLMGGYGSRIVTKEEMLQIKLLKNQIQLKTLKLIIILKKIQNLKLKFQV